MTSVRSSLLIMWLAQATWIGCGGSDGVTGPGGNPADVNPAENLGSPITPSGEVSVFEATLTWTPDGSEILYTSPASPDWGKIVKVVDIAAGTIRVLDPQVGRWFDLSVSSDGRTVYVAGRYGSTLRRIMADGAVREDLLQNTDGRFSVLSPNETQMAYVGLGAEIPSPSEFINSSADSLYLYDLATGAREYLGLGRPLAFSPDGKQLLFHERPCPGTLGVPNPCFYSTLDLATRQVERLTFPEYTQEDIIGDVGPTEHWIRWDEQGIRTYVLGPGGRGRQILIRNFTLGTTTRLHKYVPGVEFPFAGLHRAWSPDGNKVAFWSHVHDGQGHYDVLYVADVRTGEKKRVVIKRTRRTGEMAFAPDGRRIAYVLGDRIFVQNLD